jgi:hypothetical protein
MVGLTLPALPQVSSGLGEALHGTPTPTATLAPYANLVYTEHWVPWGRLTIDGATIPNERLDVGRILARGAHILEYRAVPFPSLHCHLGVPASRGDTCPLDPDFQLPSGLHLAGGRAIDLGATPAHLPPDQYQALLTAAESVASRSGALTVVHTGERYVDTNHHVVVATRPLHAVFLLQLQPVGVYGGSPCAVLCATPTASLAAAGTAASDA